jgi:hypothetical protein
MKKPSLLKVFRGVSNFQLTTRNGSPVFTGQDVSEVWIFGF